jgi:hypothetical protein
MGFDVIKGEGAPPSAEQEAEHREAARWFSTIEHIVKAKSEESEDGLNWDSIDSRKQAQQYFAKLETMSAEEAAEIGKYATAIFEALDNEETRPAMAAAA